MDANHRKYLWEVLGLIGAGAVLVAILNPEFWQALYQIVMVVAAIAVVAVIGIAVAAPVFKAFAMFRQPSKQAEERNTQREDAQSSREQVLIQGRLTDATPEGQTYTKPGDPRQVVYAMYQGRECSVYAPVTGIPVTPEEIKTMLAKHKADHPDAEVPTLEQVLEYQAWYRGKYWEPRLHEIGAFIAVR